MRAKYLKFNSHNDKTGNGEMWVGYEDGSYQKFELDWQDGATKVWKPTEHIYNKPKGEIE